MKNKKLFAILTLICFALTMMPVAAFAEPAVDTSAFVAIDGDQTVKTGKAVKFIFAGNDEATKTTTGSLDFLVWAKDATGAVSSAMEVVGEEKSEEYRNAYAVSAEDGQEFKIKFARAGKYTVYAGVVEGTATANLNNAQLLGGSASVMSVITVIGQATDPENTYAAKVEAKDGEGYSVTSNGIVEASKADLTLGTLTITPNNVATDKITVTFYDEDQKLTGKTVAIETSTANIAVSKETAVTNILGQVQFTVSASREGNYYIYLTVDGIEYKLAVACGNTAAAAIENVKQPKAPVALFDGIAAGDVQFNVTDINGNTVKDAKAATPQGMNGIFNGTKYLVFTEKPVASSLENGDLKLVWNKADGVYDLIVPTMDAEGTYTVKAILDNGAFATATWTVKRFQTPVNMYIEVARQVELGKVLAPQVKYVDANGVVKAAKDATVSANGHVISTVVGNMITLKTDEKYAGTNFQIIATSSRYNMVATATVAVVEATQICFEEPGSLAVNANNKIDYFFADENGAGVKVNAVWGERQYIVLDKPEGAKVTVWETKFDQQKAVGQFALTSSKVGNVTVQVVAKATINTSAATGEGNLVAPQNKYYTGTKVFAVGTEGTGDVVVMSVGSSEIVINDKKAAIDAAPMVQNSRTFVPFRALAEAFGATVAYDEATQSVTAEMNGTTVVMTIGSATYTVNGVEKAADVAPFISASRTYVPVRFAAEAFGIKVIPTYDEKGATADVLFVK